MELVSDRRWFLDAGPDAVWAALADTAEYRTWWPWLTSFDAAGLVAGARWRCTVRPPLRYSVRFAIDLEQVEPSRLLAARVTGDITGRARVDITECGARSEVRLTSALTPTRRSMAVIRSLLSVTAPRRLLS